MDETPPRKRQPTARQRGKQIQPWAPPRYTNAAFAEEQRQCWELRLRGMSLRQIAGHTGLSKSTVENRLRCEFEEYRQDSAQLREQYIQIELERLDAATVVVLSILEANHILVSDGRIVTLEDEDGRKIPLPDSGPILAAIREYRMLSESRRKLLGLDAPTRHEHKGTDDIDSAVIKLAALMDELDTPAQPPISGQL